jgi:hypothetical protein
MANRHLVVKGSNSPPELPRIHPFLLQDGPEVLGQAARHIIIRQPAVAAIAPAGAPGVADEEGAFGLHRGVLGSGPVDDLELVVVADGGHGMAALDALARGGERDAAVRLGLLDGIVNGEAEHRRVALGEIRLQVLEEGRRGCAGRIVPEVLDGLVVLGEGVAEGRGLAVEGLLALGVGPVGLGRHAEEDHGPDRRAQVGARVALELHQVAGDLVEEEARGVEVAAEGAALVVLDEGGPGVGRARAENALVLDGRAMLAEIDRGREVVGADALAERRERAEGAGAASFGGGPGGAGTGGELRVGRGIDDVADLAARFVVVAEVGVVGEPAHAPARGSGKTGRFHRHVPFVRSHIRAVRIIIVSSGKTRFSSRRPESVVRAPPRATSIGERI